MSAPALSSPSQPPTSPAPAILSGLTRRAVTSVGRTVRSAIGALGKGAAFTLGAIVSAREVRTWAPHVGTQARLLGVNSIPIGMFISGFTGIVLALLASYSFTGAIPLYFVGTLVQKAVTMELAPVLTGLALAGRVGANIAAELGTMRVTEQVDALETLSFDPLAYLVVPRVIAGTLMFPIVVGLSMVAGIVAGWLASYYLLDLSSPQFVKGMRLFFEYFDVRYGLVKAASFGFAVALVGCAAGLGTRGGSQGVGQAATSAVVRSAVLILVLDAFWAVVWLLGRAT